MRKVITLIKIGITVNEKYNSMIELTQNSNNI